MPRNASHESYVIPKQQNNAVLQGLIRQLGGPRGAARAAGLDTTTNEGKALIRSLERLREDRPKGGKQASSRASEVTLARLERAAERRGIRVTVVVDADLRRRLGEPATRRQYRQEVAAADALRRPLSATQEAAPIPADYYGDEDEIDWQAIEDADDPAAALEEALAEVMELQRLEWQ